MTRKVIHLIPYDGIGGVEEAARTMRSIETPGINFEVAYVFPDVQSATQRARTFSLRAFWRALAHIRKASPELLIVSLWRSALVGVMAKLLNPRLKLVLFVHNSRDAHAIDRLVTRLALAWCDEVWADSEASIENRFTKPVSKPKVVISYLAHKLAPLPREGAPAPAAPVFAFWGRLSRQKNLDGALTILEMIRATSPGARLIVIGPDGGEEAALRDRVAHSAIRDAVAFLGPLPFDQIAEQVRGADFYLQTSIYEGMSLAVTEAMQLGLPPVVTPVGEIANYCEDRRNAIFVSEDLETSVNRIQEVLSDTKFYFMMRNAAISTWIDVEPYNISVIDASKRCLER